MRKSEVSATWVQRQRLEFIEFRLLWEGSIRRRHLMAHYAISMQQASLDFARYAELSPGNAVYDRQKKAYIPSPEFRPQLVGADATTYLNQLLGLTLDLLPAETALLGWVPPSAAVRLPERHVSATVLRHVLHAIRERFSLRIDYQSMSRDREQERSASRTVSPHALVHDGARWHMRAYCHTRMQFRDFALGRVLGVHRKVDGTVDPVEDKEWHNLVEVVLAPAPELTAAQKRAVELDYRMRDGAVVMKVREALLFYMQQRFGRRPSQLRQVIMVNEDDLFPTES